MRELVVRCVIVAASAWAAASAGAAPFTVKVTGADGAALQDAIVVAYVDGVPARAVAPAVAEIAQRGKRFVPAVLAVQTGTPVNFPNQDTVRHHVYSFSPIKSFEIKLYAGTPAAPVTFDLPGTAVLGCNIHDKMIAFVHVVDTPYFARTDEQGRAQLELPAGRHRFHVWHPGLPDEAPPPKRQFVLPAEGAALTVALPAQRLP